MNDELSVTFLGTGTSQGVPLIACPCKVCNSDDGKDKRLRSSVLLESKGKYFVIDTGPDFRQQMLRERVKNICAVIFTHEHMDHITGLDDVRAYNYITGKPVDVYATVHVQNSLKRVFQYIFDGTEYPGIPQIDMHTITDKPFKIDGVDFIPIQAYHHKLPVLGFRVGDFSYITDANYLAESELEKVRGSKVIVLNALRKTKHISHFTLTEAVAILRELKPQVAYLTHISHQLGLHEEIESELPPDIRLAYDGLKINIR